MINPMNRSTPIRMMGMASGMDTDFIIQNAMRVHQMRIDNVMRQRTLVEWRQQTHNSIRDQLRDFQSSLISMQSTRSMFRSQNFNTHVAELTGANRNAFSITTRADSHLGSFSVLGITSMARGMRVTSSNRLAENPNQALNLNARLEDLRFAAGAPLQFQDDTVTFTEGDQDVVINRRQDGTNWTYTFNGQALDFETHALLSGGRARIDLGNDEGFYVTRLANGNLARIAEDLTGNEISSGMRLVVNQGTETQTTVTIREVPGAEPGDSATWEWSIGSGTSEITGAIEFTAGEPFDLVASINEGIAAHNAYHGFNPDNDGYVAELDESDIGVYLNMDNDGVITTSGFTSEAGVAVFGELVSGPIEINGEEFELRRNMTLNDLMRQINNHPELNVTISFDQMQDRFTIQSNNVGDGPESQVTISGLDFLGLSSVDGNISDITQGSLSEVIIMTQNGEILTLSGGDTNSVNFGGVTININQTFNTGVSEVIRGIRDGVLEENPNATAAQINAAVRAHFDLPANSENIVNVGINRNVDQVVENITDFINSYNAIITRIEGLLRERKTPAERSYMPLTDEEKQHMTERQIEQWEEIARRGIMRNDHGLEALARELRSSFFETVASAGMRPSDIGLTTGDFFGGTGGKIFIDEDRLRAALQEDPDRVMDLFTAGNIHGTPRSEQGLVTRINNAINGFIGISGATGTQRNTLNSLERSIRNMNQQIERMTIRMFAEEDRLFRQFAAMERAMSQLQSQGDWFNSMLGAMN